VRAKGERSSSGWTTLCGARDGTVIAIS
jgi:hypothetical protein